MKPAAAMECVSKAREDHTESFIVQAVPDIEEETEQTVSYTPLENHTEETCKLDSPTVNECNENSSSTPDESISADEESLAQIDNPRLNVARILGCMKSKFPGSGSGQRAMPLADLYRDKKLIDLFNGMFPGTTKNSYIQFIPELSNDFSRKVRRMSNEEKERHETFMSGVEYEKKIQKKLAAITEQQLIIFTNVQPVSIKDKRLKRVFTSEFDDIIFDLDAG